MVVASGQITAIGVNNMYCDWSRVVSIAGSPQAVPEKNKPETKIGKNTTIIIECLR